VSQRRGTISTAVSKLKAAKVEVAHKKTKSADGIGKTIAPGGRSKGTDQSNGTPHSIRGNDRVVRQRRPVQALSGG
jgi:hypothetical protein